MAEKAKGKIITDVAIARKLIQSGNRVIDIKPRHGNPEATVFVFESSIKLDADIQEIISQIRGR